jgi:hypothetical protein
MKPINDYIVERIRIDNISMDTLPENLKNKYKLIYNTDTGMYDCSDSIKIDDDLIEDGRFKCNFGVVKGYFDCSECKSLTSLEGASEEVGGSFYCYRCDSLTSLKRAPKEVGGSFDCRDCPSLKNHNIKTKIGGKFVK